MQAPAAIAYEWEPIQALPARGDNVWLGRGPGSGRLLCLTRCAADVAAGARPAVGRSVEGVADVVEVGIEGTEGFVLGAWTAGMTLEELILLSGSIPADRARRIVGSVVRSLEALHACGAVHGFVSPASIVIAGEGERTVLTHAAPDGDPRRHSPERSRDGLPSTADDVWALHLVLLEALTGDLSSVEGASIGARGCAVERSRLDEALRRVADPALRVFLAEGLNLASGRRATASSTRAALESPPEETKSATTVPAGVCLPRAPARKSVRKARWAALSIAAGVLCATLVVVAAGRWLAARRAVSEPDRPAAAPVACTAAPSAVLPETPSPSALPPTVPSAPPRRDVESCVRSHFPPGAFEPERSLAPVCHGTNGKDLASFLTSSLVLSSDGRLTEGMDEWSRLQGFQPVVLALLRRRCCSSPTPFEDRTPGIAQFWNAAEATAAALDQGRPDVAAMVRYRKAAVRAGEHWWYAAPPCTGGQRWLDRFLTRGGGPASADELCRASIGL